MISGDHGGGSGDADDDGDAMMIIRTIATAFTVRSVVRVPAILVAMAILASRIMVFDTGN